MSQPSGSLVRVFYSSENLTRNFPAEQNLNSESSCMVFTAAGIIFFAGTSGVRIFW